MSWIGTRHPRAVMRAERGCRPRQPHREDRDESSRLRRTRLAQLGLNGGPEVSRSRPMSSSGRLHHDLRYRPPYSQRRPASDQARDKFATDCRWLQPRGSITAPSLVICLGNSLPGKASDPLPRTALHSSTAECKAEDEQTERDRDEEVRIHRGQPRPWLAVFPLGRRQRPRPPAARPVPASVRRRSGRSRHCQGRPP